MWNRRPSRVASIAAQAVHPACGQIGSMIASALGCNPSPNSAAIWASLTCEPSATVQISSTAWPVNRAGTGVAQRRQPRADPAARGFPFGRVVVREGAAATLGGVGGGDLPDQVQVAVAGGELVQAHHGRKSPL